MAEIEEIAAATPVWGCGCDEAPKTASDCDEVDEGVLTPGDTVPAGRCPACYGLVYPDRPEDRRRDAAEALYGALAPLLGFAEGFEDDETQEGVAGWVEDARAALVRAERREV